MLNKRYLFAGFILVALVQLFVPANMIWQAEGTIREGNEFHFKVAPVDPNDPFRGKYISLAFEADEITVPGNNWAGFDEVYARIHKGKDGFAQIQDLSQSPPEDTEDFIRVAVYMMTQFKDSTAITISYPFDRYYMEESKALAAEKLYSESVSDSRQRTYGVVFVKNGKASLTDVRINDLSIQEAVARQQ